MDSVTQFLLGAGIAGAAMGPKIGPRALLLGGIVATLPDLDSFLPTANAIDAMTEHRGASHSLITLTIAAPIISLAAMAAMPSLRKEGKLTLATLWLCLVTHALLDALTTYGTQLFWPLQIGPPVAVPAVFIIDPVYTLLLFGGFLALIFMRQERARGVRTVRMCLAISTAYLVLGLSGQFVVKAQAKANPAFEGQRILVQPAPLNILFWQILAVGEDRYSTAMTTIVPGCKISQIDTRPRLTKPPSDKLRTPSVQRLEWFTNGYYTYREFGDSLRISDLRLGLQQNLAFKFDIAQRQNGQFIPTLPVQVEDGGPTKQILPALMSTLRRTWAEC